MEIVEDFDEKSYNNNNNGEPWKSSKILNVKPNFFIFSLFIISLHFFVIFSFFSFFHFFHFLHFFIFLHVFTFFFIFFFFFSFSIFHFSSFSSFLVNFHFFIFSRFLDFLHHFASVFIVVFLLSFLFYCFLFVSFGNVCPLNRCFFSCLTRLHWQSRQRDPIGWAGGRLKTRLLACLLGPHNHSVMTAAHKLPKLE